MKTNVTWGRGALVGAVVCCASMAVTFSACSSDDPVVESAPTGGGAKPVHSAPGLLVTGPKGLVLAPGKTAKLLSRLVDSAGAPLPTPLLAWASDDSSVLTVDATGAVTAVAEGLATVSVTDGVHGTQLVTVEVSSAPPSGPQSVAFDPPLMVLAAGASRPLAAGVLAADGAPVDPAPAVTFESRNPSVATVDAAGEVHAVGQGMATIVASVVADGGTKVLAGAHVVLVADASAVTGGGEVAADAGVPSRLPPPPYRPMSGNALQVVGCSFTNGGAPFVMNKPGLTFSPLVYVMSIVPSKPPIAAYYAQQSPDTMTFQTDGIAHYVPSTGLVTSDAPGNTTYVATVAGVKCDGSWGGAPIHVGVDVGDAWTASCDNEDVGSLSFGPMRGSVMPGQTWGGGNGSPQQVLTGTSCVKNTPEGFTCKGAASAWDHGAIGGLAEQLCSESTPCNSNVGVPGSNGSWAGFSSCAGARWGVGVAVHGPDHLRVGSCDITRGGTAGSCDESDAGDPAGDPCPVLYAQYQKKGGECCAADPSSFLCKGSPAQFLSGCEKQWATTPGCKQALTTLTACVSSTKVPACSDAKKLVFSGCESQYAAWVGACGG